MSTSTEETKADVLGRTDVKWLVTLAVVVVAFIGPFVLSESDLRIVTLIFFAISIAGAYNIIGGYTGYPSFGHVVFLGIGAYSSAILMDAFQLNWWLTIPLGGLVAFAIALPLGPILLRLDGHYFAIATLALHLAVVQYVGAIQFFGGGTGWFLRPVMNFNQFYWAFLLMAIGITLTVFEIDRSQIGTALLAINKNEERAETLGIPTTLYKNVAWTISAFMVGVIGVLYGSFLTFVSRDSVFTLDLTLDMIMYGVVGGMGTVLGPVLGAVTLKPLEELVWSRFLDLHVTIRGLIIILFVLFFPGGIVPWLRRTVGIYRAGGVAGLVNHAYSSIGSLTESVQEKFR